MLLMLLLMFCCCYCCCCVVDVVVNIVFVAFCCVIFSVFGCRNLVSAFTLVIPYLCYFIGACCFTFWFFRYFLIVNHTDGVEPVLGAC